MLLQLFDSWTEITNTGEHLIMFLLESLHLLPSLNDFLFELSNSLEGLFVSSLWLIQMLLHVASSCNSLNSKSLLSLELILKIVSFRHKLIMLLLKGFHLLQSFIFLIFTFNSECSFSSEHGWEQLSVRWNLFNILCKLSLVLFSVLQFRQVEVVILSYLVLSFFEQLPLTNLIWFQIFKILLDFLNLESFGQHFIFQLLELVLLIELILVIIIFILIQFGVHLLIFIPKLNHFDIELLYLHP